MPKIVDHITYNEYLDLKENSTKLINKRTSLRRLLKLLEQHPNLIDYLYIYQTMSKNPKEAIYSMYIQLQDELQRLDDEFKTQQKELQRQYTHVR